MLEFISTLAPETVIFGGLTLVALALVVLVWKISTRFSNHMSGVIDKNTEAWILQAKAQQRFSDTLEDFEKTINKLLEEK